MLLRLIRKEILHNILSFRFAVTYALLFILVLLAVFLMGNEHSDRMETFTREEARFRDRLEELAAMEDGGEQFRSVQQESFSGLREPAPLSVLARGLEGSLPTRVSSQQRFIMRSSDDRREVFRSAPAAGISKTRLPGTSNSPSLPECATWTARFFRPARTSARKRFTRRTKIPSTAFAGIRMRRFFGSEQGRRNRRDVDPRSDHLRPRPF